MNTRLSVLQRFILETLASAPGWKSSWEMRVLVRYRAATSGQSRNVAAASVSRCVRTLFRRGLVDFRDAYFRWASDRIEENRALLKLARENPRQACAENPWLRRYEQWADALAYLERVSREPIASAKYVKITGAGRELLKSARVDSLTVTADGGGDDR